MHTLVLLSALLSAPSAYAVDDHDEAALFGGESGSAGEAPAPTGPVPADAAPPGEHDEASLFGDPAAATTPPPVSTVAPSAPAAANGAAAGRGPLQSAILERSESALALGGQLFLRMNGAFREETAFADGAVSAPSLLDTFADVRPSDRVRGYAQLRFAFDPTVVAGETSPLGFVVRPFDLQLAQAWTKFDLGQVAYVTLGRQRIRWGPARFWNPTDFINKEIRNSVDFFDQRVGVDMVKVHFPFEQLGWNLYLIGTFGGLDVASDSGLAARVEVVVGEAELALSSFLKRDAPLRFGADVSAGIGIVDVKGEAVLSRGLGRRLFSGDLDFEGGSFPRELDVEDEWWFQGVVGAEASFKYTDTDTFSLGAEYFYNQGGYDSAALYPFLFLNDAFAPLYTGQHYVAVYAFAAGPFEWDELNLTASTIANLSDQSVLSRFDAQLVLLQYLTLNVFVAGHWGRVGEFKLGLALPPIPSVPQLANGFVLKNELVDIGGAARISF
ncbi:MAG: hypothetical protein FJ137_07910 [Deltaproteobacteria bacterium]|nr:hypothetical protein [Deltaproteobacteria bacterium]